MKPTLIHSLITPKTKLCRWLRIIQGHAGIILGTRSALLYPIKNLGLIIVDEEHDNAYRQEQSLFFSARDAAILKATSMKTPIVLGSATPSLESYYNAQQGKYNLCLLEKRYLATQPTIHMLQRPKHTFIAPNLIDIVKKELEKNHHVMLYIGKRGYSRLLKCHHCETKAKVVTDCPDCQTAELSHYGAGSQRITEIAQTLWPEYPVLRIDTDIMNSNEAASALTALTSSPATLIVGTQMLTKGHDIDRLDTVIVIDADHTLYAPDFRAEEKLFAELIQVSGRSGRRQNQGHVYIQTQSMEHMVFKSLGTPKAFYDYLLEKRQAFELPPYTYIACLFIRGSGPTLKKLQELKLPVYEGVTIIGPCLFPPGQRKRQSCYQIMISSQKRPLRNHVFQLIHQLLKRTLPKNTSLLAQIDSHLSL
jgi:primosomal protein N' (replication factor Y)